MTLDQAIQYHKMLWNQIIHILESDPHFSRDPDLLKEEARDQIIDKVDIDDKVILFNCFLCEYAQRRMNAAHEKFSILRNRCELCPMENSPTGECLGGLYSKWGTAALRGNLDDAIRYAEKIRDLEVVNTRGENLDEYFNNL